LNSKKKYRNNIEIGTEIESAEKHLNVEFENKGIEKSFS